MSVPVKRWIGTFYGLGAMGACRERKLRMDGHGNLHSTADSDAEFQTRAAKSKKRMTGFPEVNRDGSGPHRDISAECS